MLSVSRSLTLFCLVLALTVMVGCGRKTGLIPPQHLVPEPVGDLRYILDGNGATLRWSYPGEMVNGDELTGVESFEVLRARVPLEKYCEGCPVRYGDKVEVAGGMLPATGEGKTAEYRDTRLEDGYRYIYRVRSRTGGWYASRESNTVSFTWKSPAAAPDGLQIEAADRYLNLSWQPVKENILGSPLLREPLYQVYRRSVDGSFMPVGEPVGGVQYVDTGLENGRSYAYRVRALVTHGDTVQAGMDSSEISGVPRDLTPPPTPEHLAAVKTPEGIKLVWQAVSADDLAGYRIYRRDDRSAEPGLAGQVGPGRNQYIDTDVSAGRTWSYTVTAFDTAEPPNESLESIESAVDLR